jgi:site-specific DNA-methyltransferase (adenine-specific)
MMQRNKTEEHSLMKMYELYNEDCVAGCARHIKDDSIDLIITDPPYGIKGDKLHRHYNRKEDYVLDGYVEIPAERYAAFSREWIAQAERILKPGGAIYIISGYTNLRHILNALATTSLKEINHIIWKYNFGVYTSKKYISSHYHILYYVKPGADPVFNISCRFGKEEKDEAGGSRNYLDREDVWIINREYKPGQVKNKNELPKELLKKIILYSSNEGDAVCDLFLGSFSTAKVALCFGRRAVGFEISSTAFDHQIKEIKKLKSGQMLPELKKPEKDSLVNQGKRWTEDNKTKLIERYSALRLEGKTRKASIEILSTEFGRGRFAIANVVDSKK